jgi:dihydrodipicolinate synthase/N-acetylneuraminate lyase
MSSAETTAPLPPALQAAFRRGLVIPAHPLALTEARRLDERRQRALSRYYLEAGAGGLAVGVHTTEFAIHDPKAGLYRPVLELALEAAGERSGKARVGPVMIAGLVGGTEQALREACLARELGYHIGLLGLGALAEASDAQLLEHCRRVAEVIPLMGFYLQPAAGGRVLGESFWRALAELPRLVGIKIAPFNRYFTLAVVRAVAAAGREEEIALYTGNDDSILVDLLTECELAGPQGPVRLAIVGGLLGHWAYWTRRAVEQLEAAHRARRRRRLPARLLTLAAQVTESNEAVFDPENGFRGCISGILYVLARTGLVAGVHPLGEGERLSPGQAAKIERVLALYPQLSDETFVRSNLERWLRP